MAPCPEACSSTCRSFCIGIAVGALIGATGLVKSKPPSPEGATPVSVYQPYLRPEALDAADAANHSAMAATQPTRTEAHRQQPATAPAFEPRARAARAAVRPPAGSSTQPAQQAPPAVRAAVPKASFTAPAGRSKDYTSLGTIGPLPSVVDIAAPGMARHVAQTRSYKGELIMFTSDSQMGGWAYHWVHQMRRMGYEHWMILADQAKTCDTLQEGWKPMMSGYQEELLSCTWSSYPRSHPGWTQWTDKRRGPDSMHNVYILWSTRWWVAWQLLQQGTNVLSLDVDAVLMTDIYALLRSPPLVHQDVIITRNSDASQSLNCGFVYFNRQARTGAPAMHQQSAAKKCGAAHGADGAVPAAEWVARAMWDRTQLFLEIDRPSLSKSPAREVLWEQDAWNDLAKSLELNRRVFPWAVGYGKSSDLWKTLGYERHVEGGEKHREKWVEWRHVGRDRRRGHKPPWEAPSEEHAAAFWDHDLNDPLRWLQLCAPANTSSTASAAVPAGTLGGIPLGLVSARPLAAGRLMLAPAWLASLGDDPQPDWAASSPPAFSYLHLTNMWHCFPHMCWSKAGRLFWLRAHGFWDERLDSLGITPRGKPFDSRTRVLALPPETYEAIKALTPPHGGNAPTTAKERWYAFRRAHALVHNLVTVALLLGRRPVIPEVPCSFIRAIQPRKSSNPSERARFGINHPSVIVTGSADAPTCHLTPGTWRPGGPDQCYHNKVMHEFDFRKLVASRAASSAASQSNGSIVAPRPPLPTSADSTPAERSPSADRAAVAETFRTMCTRGAELEATAIVELGGLLPARDFLLDAPLDFDEFRLETKRLASRKPRWRSMLRGKVLKKLEGVCPGAAEFDFERKACIGYSLAE